jgi:adenylosuccinate synthase
MGTNKVVDVLIGMAAGSEAKGKLIGVIANDYEAMVRTGSTNAAHTTYYKGKGYPWHLIPCGALTNQRCWLILGAGMQLEVDRLFHEIQWLKDNDAWMHADGKPRLLIDPKATIIDPIDLFAENGWQEVCGPQWYAPTTCEWHEGLKGPDGAVKVAKTCEGCRDYPKDSLHRALGSTTHGCGYNLIRKLARVAPDGVHAGLLRDNKGNPVPRVRTAAEIPELAEFLGDTEGFLNQLVDQNKTILIEGTQGSVLSMHHGYWPKSTSRDTNASNWVMEAGLSPVTVRKVFGVTRTFPIRVFGNSGPFGSPEITWEEVTKQYYGLSGTMTDEALTQWLKDNNKEMLCEITTATKRRRRVFRFSEKDFNRAYQINRPEEMMLSFVDYLNVNDFGKSNWDDLTIGTKVWITQLEERIGKKFKYLSTGPDEGHLIVRN